MDPELKAAVKADLDKFKQSKKSFGRVGRAWKRGYLLHGPLGTGKTSKVAAMAHYLKYNVFDSELTQVRTIIHEIQCTKYVSSKLTLVFFAKFGNEYL